MWRLMIEKNERREKASGGVRLAAEAVLRVSSNTSLSEWNVMWAPFIHSGLLNMTREEDSPVDYKSARRGEDTIIVMRIMMKSSMMLRETSRMEREPWAIFISLTSVVFVTLTYLLCLCRVYSTRIKGERSHLSPKYESSIPVYASLPNDDYNECCRDHYDDHHNEKDDDDDYNDDWSLQPFFGIKRWVGFNDGHWVIPGREFVSGTWSSDSWFWSSAGDWSIQHPWISWRSTWNRRRGGVEYLSFCSSPLMMITKTRDEPISIK